MELDMDEDLRARIEILERELQARTLVLEHLFTKLVLEEEERKQPGINAVWLEQYESQLSRAREGETPDLTEAIRASFRRVLTSVTTLPPWRASQPAHKLVLTIEYLWKKLRRLVKPRDREDGPRDAG